MVLKAALLDIDGTLVDSNDLHVKAWQAAFRRHGKEIPAEALHAQMGKGGDLVVAEFLSEAERRRCGKAIEDAHVEIFVRDFQPHERPLPGVRPLMQRFKAEGMRIVLATSAREEEIRAHLRVLQVDDLVDSRTGADDAGHSKPCPDLFEAALGELRPQEAIVVGDSPWDAVAARKAGIPMLGVLTGGFRREALLSRGASAVYSDLEELRERWT